jgi:hypothetical protein
MATPQERLAKSLEALSELQDRGVVAIRAADLDKVGCSCRLHAKRKDATLLLLPCFDEK